MERTRCTAGVLTTSRSLLELPTLALNVRTSALDPGRIAEGLLPHVGRQAELRLG